jgi:acetyl esterase/lipase
VPTNPSRRHFVAAVLGGTLAGCGDSNTAPPPHLPSAGPPTGGEPGQRIAYGKNSEQFGELRLPEGDGPHPVVVVIHGGFWQAAYDLKHLYPFSAALTAAGWATWSIEYRRVGQEGGGWPDTFDDVAAATDALRDLAAPHSLDLRRVFAIGHSAGGHLALWTASRHRIPVESAVYRKSPLPVKGVVSLAGVCDLRQAWDLKLGGGVVRGLLGGTPEEFSDRYSAASPADLLPLGVPQVLVHGEKDAAVPFAMSQAYQKKATERGDAARLVALPDAGHFEVIDPRSKEWPQIVEALASLR